MSKIKVSKKAYKEMIDEILAMRESLEKDLGVYTTNAIDRLVIARIQLNNCELDSSLDDNKDIKQEEH